MTEEVKVKRPVGRPRKPRDPAVEAAKEEAKRARTAAKLAKLAAEQFNDQGQAYEPVPPNCTPLEYLQGVMRGQYFTDQNRLKAAEVAARFVHVSPHDGGKKDERQRKASEVAQGRFAPGAAPTRPVH